MSSIDDLSCSQWEDTIWEHIEKIVNEGFSTASQECKTDKDGAQGYWEIHIALKETIEVPYVVTDVRLTDSRWCRAVRFV